jgi:hypothetical protein
MWQNLAQTAVKAQENVGFSLCGTLDDCAQTSRIRGSAIMERDLTDWGLCDWRKGGRSAPMKINSN